MVQELPTAWLPQHAALSITLSATTGFVVLILGFAFHWQSTRAREGDLINDARPRPDRHRAQSRPLRPVGLGPVARQDFLVAVDVRRCSASTSRSDLLTFGEVNALVRSDDIDLFVFANRLMRGRADHFDEIFRMRHVSGHWIWLRVRCEVVRSGGRHRT